MARPPSFQWTTVVAATSATPAMVKRIVPAQVATHLVTTGKLAGTWTNVKLGQMSVQKMRNALTPMGLTIVEKHTDTWVPETILTRMY